MSTQDLEKIRFMRQENPWWQTGEVPSQNLEPFKRRDFYKICERISDRQIISLTGLRRVGKTTLLYQLIDHLLGKEKIQRTRILMLTLDNPFWKDSNSSLLEIFNLYTNAILKEPVFNSSLNKELKQVYIFLDEIQYWQDWENILKSIYDKNYPIKIIISGSSSLHLYARSAESLVGRIHHQLIFPFLLRRSD